MNVIGHAASTHPMVPPIRTIPNSFCASFICANAMEFVIEIVGRRAGNGRASREKRPERPRHTSEIMAMPPMRWLAARNRSAAKFLSANWLLKNMPTMAAIGKALRIQVCSVALKPRLGR